jgi:hypothetical protein
MKNQSKSILNFALIYLCLMSYSALGQWTECPGLCTVRDKTKVSPNELAAIQTYNFAECYGASGASFNIYWKETRPVRYTFCTSRDPKISPEELRSIQTYNVAECYGANRANGNIYWVDQIYCQ